HGDRDRRDFAEQILANRHFQLSLDLLYHLAGRRPDLAGGAGRGVGGGQQLRPALLGVGQRQRDRDGGVLRHRLQRRGAELRLAEQVEQWAGLAGLDLGGDRQVTAAVGQAEAGGQRADRLWVDQLLEHGPHRRLRGGLVGLEGLFHLLGATD